VSRTDVGHLGSAPKQRKGGDLESHGRRGGRRLVRRIVPILVVGGAAAVWPLAALADASGGGVTPSIAPGNPADCASDLGITGATTYKYDSNKAGTATDGVLTVTVTTSDTITFGITAQLPSGDVILAVLAKGGSQGGNLYDYRGQTGGGVLSDSNLHPPPTGNLNQYAGISHILLCYGKGSSDGSNGGNNGSSGGTTTTTTTATTTPTTPSTPTTTPSSPSSSIQGSTTIKKHKKHKNKKKHKKHVKAKKVTRPRRPVLPAFTG